MILQGQVGPQVNGDGAYANARQDRQGNVCVSEVNPRYYENTYRGQKFSATYTAAALAAAAAASTFVLVNPTGSGKNLVFDDACTVLTAYIAQTLIGTGAVVGWSPNGTLGTVGTVVVPQNCLIGNGNASVAKAYQTATLGNTPVAIRQIAGWTLGTATPGSDVIGAIHDDIGGALMLTPGFAIALFGLGGAAADLTIQPTLTWDEVAI